MSGLGVNRSKTALFLDGGSQDLNYQVASRFGLAQGLKLIWLIFVAGGSLWVSWVRRNLIGDGNFWELEPHASQSWVWKNICNLRNVDREFVFCEVGSGITAKFWDDNWTSLGPLINIIGHQGPRVTGNAIPTAKFSTAQTWRHLNPPGDSVLWHSSVWFSGRIPKHAFITWVAVWNRMATRDRLRSWGVEVSSVCVLCNAADETRQHIYFDCPFSQAVWTHFTSKAAVVSPILFEDSICWLKNASRDKNLLLILNFLFQATVYILWKERNVRVHNQISRSPDSLITEIQSIIRCRLDPLSREQRNLLSVVTYLSTWFSIFQPN
ncbi:hypothetical protein N665_0872s0008 [Sinapis alba]|nr:hypothetical protein N665_0872s0008 [Sinapis alba]